MVEITNPFQILIPSALFLVVFCFCIVSYSNGIGFKDIWNMIIKKIKK